MTITRQNPSLPPSAANLAAAARDIFAQAAAWACCSELSAGDGPSVGYVYAALGPWAPKPKALWARALLSSGTRMLPDTWAVARISEAYTSLAEVMTPIGGIAPFGSGRRHAHDAGGKVPQACAKAVRAALTAAATRTTVDALTGGVGPDAPIRQVFLEAAWPTTWYAVRRAYGAILTGDAATWSEVAAEIVAAVAREWEIPSLAGTGLRCSQCGCLRITAGDDHPAHQYACHCLNNDACPRCGGWGDECTCGLVACPDCKGTGLAYEPPSPACDTCEGHGWITLKTPPEPAQPEPDPYCDLCGGDGVINEAPGPDCGEGWGATPCTCVSRRARHRRE